MLRIFILLLLIFAIFNQFLWLSGLLFVWYLFKYAGFELVILAILLDGYYGAFYHFPRLTIIVFSLFFFTTITKERLLLYTQRDEIIS